MNLRRLIIAALAVAVVIGIAGVVVTFLPTKDGGSVSQDLGRGLGFGGTPTEASSSRPQPTGAGGSTGGTGTSDTTGTPGKPGTSGTVPNTATQSPTQPGGTATLAPNQPPAPGKRTSSEVLIPTATPTPYRLPPVTPPPSIAPDAVPADAYASGALVKGFPAALTVAPDSKITSSSVSSQDKTIQVTLTATSSSNPADTLSYYQALLTSLGMTGESLPAVGGRTAVGFSRDGDTVTLTVSPHNTTGTNYSISGVLHVGS